MPLRFGDFVFDADARQLLRRGVEVHVSPKAFHLLQLLLDGRPRAVSKQTLHEQLWPATFVSESNLATLVGELRAALEDSARRPRFVRTVQRFGYAYCGDVEEISNGTPQPAVFCWLIANGRRLPLKWGENILGREAGNGFGIDSVTVSRQHARITVSERGAQLEDLESKNGTFLNGGRIAGAAILVDGAEIRTGSLVFHFRMTAPDGSTASWTGSRAAAEG